jgi:hypothetical protein
MTAIDFPNSPAIDDLFTQGDITWQWDGSVWKGLGTTTTGPAGIAISEDEPESNQVLWLDTDEEPDVPVPAGGSAGQLLAKVDSTDYNTQWRTSDGVRVFADAAARTSAIATPVEGMVSYLNSIDSIQTYNGSAWVTTSNAGVPSYNLVQTLYYTSSGTFNKATYPWLRAIKVTSVGGGGGGAGAGTDDAFFGAGGGGGGLGITFETNITGLAASLTVTIGAGGAGGTGDANGASGGTTQIGSFGVATGGGGGNNPRSGSSRGGPGGNGGANQLSLVGSPGGSGMNAFAGFPINSQTGGNGGSSAFGSGGGRGGDTQSAANNGENGFNYGGGGGGARRATASSNGGAGSSGLVVVELYA